MKAGQSRPAYFICKGGQKYASDCSQTFGSEKKLTKKKLYDFVALICEVPKEDIEDVEIGEDEQGIIYVVTIRG